MNTVVLYFPYIINLKAFIIMERLGNVSIDPGDPFLKTTLSDYQIEKACSAYGAVIM